MKSYKNLFFSISVKPCNYKDFSWEKKIHVLGFFTAIETKRRYQTILKTIKIRRHTKMKNNIGLISFVILLAKVLFSKGTKNIGW